MTSPQHRNFGIRHNPEAPLDGMDDPWREPPAPRLKWWWWVLVGLICGLAFILLLESARAHDHNRPDLDLWFRQQFSVGHGPCCDGTDAAHVSDVDWDTTCKDDKCHYRVMAYDKWWDVSDDAVVYGPNLSGTALLWAVPTRDQNGEVISLFIRCFMPGAGG